MGKKIRREVRYTTINGDQFYGVVGEVTNMTYKDGSFAHIGDLVGIYHHNKSQRSESLIVKEENGIPFIMGLASYKDNTYNGKVGGSSFLIKLINKHDQLEDGKYRDGILEIVTIEPKPKQPKPKQPKKTFPITVQVKADLLFDKPVIEDTNGEDVFIFSGRSVIYFNKLLGEFGISTCNSNELKSYDKEIGKALAYYRCMEKVKSE